MTLRHHPGQFVMATVILLAALLFGFNVAHAQTTSAGLSTSFENGALTIHGTNFSANTRVIVQTTLAGTVRQFSAGSGPQGDFVLNTNMPISANTPLDMEARDERGMIKTLRLVTPATVVPFHSVILTPGAATIPRTGEVPQLGAVLLGLLLVLLGAMTVTGRKESWSYSDMRSQTVKA